MRVAQQFPATNGKKNKKLFSSLSPPTSIFINTHTHTAHVIYPAARSQLQFKRYIYYIYRQCDLIASAHASWQCNLTGITRLVMGSPPPLKIKNALIRSFKPLTRTATPFFFSIGRYLLEVLTYVATCVYYIYIHSNWTSKRLFLLSWCWLLCCTHVTFVSLTQSRMCWRLQTVRQQRDGI